MKKDIGRVWESILEEVGQMLQTFSYAINKYQGCSVQHDNYS